MLFFEILNLTRHVVDVVNHQQSNLPHLLLVARQILQDEVLESFQ